MGVIDSRLVTCRHRFVMLPHRKFQFICQSFWNALIRPGLSTLESSGTAFGFLFEQGVYDTAARS